MPDNVISLVDADPELGELLDEGDYERARREALARVSRLSPGVWDAAAALERDAHHRGFLIADGLMAREVDVMGRRCCELLGHGDVLRPWAWDAEGSHVQAEVGWTVLEETTLAVLDHGLVKRIVPWPTLGVELFNRGTRRAHHLAVALAISHHQRVDDRLLLTLWHLAERWGRVTPTGIVVPLPLGHQRLADLVGAHRPSVTTRAGRAHPRRVDLAPRGRQLAAARRAAGAAAPPQARLVDLLARARRGRLAGGERRGGRGLEAPGVEPDHAGVRVLEARRARSSRGRGRAAAARRGRRPTRARGPPGR